jgi:hypothetical protein
MSTRTRFYRQTQVEGRLSGGEDTRLGVAVLQLLVLEEAIDAIDL